MRDEMKKGKTSSCASSATQDRLYGLNGSIGVSDPFFILHDILQVVEAWLISIMRGPRSELDLADITIEINRNSVVECIQTIEVNYIQEKKKNPQKSRELNRPTHLLN